MWVPEESLDAPVSGVRAYLGSRLLLLCVLAAFTGLTAGLASGLFVFKWNEWNSPSFGAFIAPSALLGWLALRPRHAAVVGAAALAAAATGHFVGAQFTEYDQNNLEYRAWAVISVVLGLLLGWLGHTIRSRRLIARACAAGVLVAWICVPFYLGLDTEYYVENTNLLTRFLDLSAAVVLLSLCRGVAARIAALVCAALFLWPLNIVSVLNSMLLWRAGGGL
ncbi:hypothetical protein BJF83_24450 [Nocardiopsis sp. CNR-923]|uniref:DUF6518 family protein n=1 Tax=Nocardiopsis sp. CNR-923 TaxID=1904965 RepID=UPI00096A0F7A|nr:DUF6518 family protein [Nocardiopsis sp. CNR-923]OLT30768.1 hypothetical protein BJF83_24450 [Nocardiopsis sp. CNR-923]